MLCGACKRRLCRGDCGDDDDERCGMPMEEDKKSGGGGDERMERWCCVLSGGIPTKGMTYLPKGEPWDGENWVSPGEHSKGECDVFALSPPSLFNPPLPFVIVRSASPPRPSQLTLHIVSYLPQHVYWTPHSDASTPATLTVHLSALSN